MFDPILCAQCGIEFTPVRAKQLCCSPRCKSAHTSRMKTAAKTAAQMRECPICGDEYRALRNKPTCSPGCYQKLPLVRARKREADRKGFAKPESRTKRLEYDYLRKYGITLAQYDEMYAAQGGECAICAATSDRRLHVDHDHATGAVRSLLCTRCNPGIGYFMDDPALLRAAADYLEAHQSTEEQVA